MIPNHKFPQIIIYFSHSRKMNWSNNIFFILLCAKLNGLFICVRCITIICRFSAHMRPKFRKKMLVNFCCDLGMLILVIWKCLFNSRPHVAGSIILMSKVITAAISQGAAEDEKRNYVLLYDMWSRLVELTGIKSNRKSITWAINDNVI